MNDYKQQILLFLYSTPHLVGSVLGLIGLSLYATGIIENYWFFIVAGSYAVGLLLTPKSERYELRLQNQMTADEIRQELERLVNTIRSKVPAEILEKVESIKESIFDILPYIVDVNSADFNIYAIRQTALDYLPETLENYLNLPRAFANLHPIRDGKNARQLLLEQLELLDKEMKEIVIDFNQNNTQRLLAHGRFLENKFRNNDLSLGL